MQVCVFNGSAPNVSMNYEKLKSVVPLSQSFCSSLPLYGALALHQSLKLDVYILFSGGFAPWRFQLNYILLDNV
jgi:hypothetical protein